MKTVYVLQPGKLGDLIITSPIIKFYKKHGYAIKWFVFNNFISFFNRIEDVEVITFNRQLDNTVYNSNKRQNFSDQKSVNASVYFFEDVRRYISQILKKEDIFLDISFGFPNSNKFNNLLIKTFDEFNRNWIDMKYFLANVPLEYRWNFSWVRDETKENNLLEKIQEISYKKYNSTEYSLIHNYIDNNHKLKLTNPIDFKFIEGYEIYDWYKVILNAREIFCVDSCLCNFVEVLPSLKDKKKVYLGTEEPHYFKYMRNILLNNWHDSNDTKIVSDYADKII